MQRLAPEAKNETGLHPWDLEIDGPFRRHEQQVSVVSSDPYSSSAGGARGGPALTRSSGEFEYGNHGLENGLNLIVTRATDREGRDRWQGRPNQ